MPTSTKHFDPKTIFNECYDRNAIDGPNTGQLRVKLASGISVGTVTIDIIRNKETDTAAAADIDYTTLAEVDAHNIAFVGFTRTTNEAIDVEFIVVNGALEFVVQKFTNFVGNNIAINDFVKLDDSSKFKFKTTGAGAGTLNLLIIKEIY